MITWFTSDHHFGSATPARLQRRGFASMKEHDEFYIHNWNRVVMPDHRVFYLGDFSSLRIHEVAPYFRRLNGEIEVIRVKGHNDKSWLPSGMFDKLLVSNSDEPVSVVDPITLSGLVYGGLTNKGTWQENIYEAAPIVLSHYPQTEWFARSRGTWLLYGHTHQKRNVVKKGRFSMNVGVDANKGYPVSLREVVDHMTLCGWRRP